jgi:outer membrane protein assembly factor BamB
MLNSLRILLIGLTALLTACGGNDTTEPPAPLPDLQVEAKFIKLWSNDTGGGTGKYLLKLQPYIAIDAIYVADYKGKLSAINRETGKTMWSVDTGLAVSAGVGGGVGSGLLLLGTSNGELAAFWQKDGKPAWRKNLNSEILAPPAVEAGVVVARTTDGNLQAFTASSGETLWSYKLTVPTLSLRGTSRPIIYGGAVLSGTDNGRLSIIALTSGQVLVEIPVAVPAGRSELARMVDIDIPALVDDGVLYVASFQGRVVAVVLQSGQTLWAANKSVYNDMSLDEENLYLVDENSHIWALHRQSGSTVWMQDKLHARPVSGVAVIENATILADFEGYIHAVDVSDGRFIARHRLDSAGIDIVPLVIDNTIYVLSRGGELTALTLKRTDSK